MSALEHFITEICEAAILNKGKRFSRTLFRGLGIHCWVKGKHITFAVSRPDVFPSFQEWITCSSRLPEWFPDQRLPDDHELGPVQMFDQAIHQIGDQQARLFYTKCKLYDDYNGEDEDRLKGLQDEAFVGVYPPYNVSKRRQKPSE